MRSLPCPYLMETPDNPHPSWRCPEVSTPNSCVSRSRGSASALRLIVRRHNQRLYRIARVKVRGDAAAEDVMQESVPERVSGILRGSVQMRAFLSVKTLGSQAVDRPAIDFEDGFAPVAKVAGNAAHRLSDRVGVDSGWFYPKGINGTLKST